MTINYTTNLALGQPVTGTESGTWGDDVNNSITAYLDIAIGGTNNITTDADVTLALTQGTNSATGIISTTAQYYILNLTGSRAAARSITAPSYSRAYLVTNATTGGYAITIKKFGGTGVAVAAGETCIVYYNTVTADYAKAVSNVITSFTGVLTGTNGGTGVNNGSSTITIGGNLTFSGAFTTALTVTANTTVTLPTTGTLGYQNIPQNSQSAAYTTVAADAGKCIFHPSTDANARTFTIDSNANVPYALGTVIQFINMTSQAVTIAITSDTLTWAQGGGSGSRTLAQWGVANVVKVGTTQWLLTGTNVT
jgi:hypothetical protein